MFLQRSRVQCLGANPQFEAKMRRAASRLPHHEARTRDARRGLAAVRHRGAASGDQQVFRAHRKKHAVRQLVIAARLALEAEVDIAGNMLLDRPAVDPNRVRKIGALEHIFL